MSLVKEKESFDFEVRVEQHRDSSEDLIQGFRFRSKKKLLTIFLSINVCLFPAAAAIFSLPILLFLRFIVQLLPPPRKLRKQTEQEILLI